jgi:hypothetical protein
MFVSKEARPARNYWTGPGVQGDSAAPGAHQ